MSDEPEAYDCEPKVFDSCIFFGEAAKLLPIVCLSCKFEKKDATMRFVDWPYPDCMVGPYCDECFREAGKYRRLG